MIYDLDFFIKKAESISEHFWQVGGFGDKDTHCVYGHCGIRQGMGNVNLMTGSEAKALFDLLEDDSSITSWVWINDGLDENYQQETPKQRVLAKLYDLKSKSAVTEAETIINQNKNQILCTT